MPMTPDAKKTLSSTIRALRARLLADLHDETERVYRLSVRAQDAGLAARERARRDRLEAWIAEQQRTDAAAGKKAKVRSDADYRRDVELQAAYTLLNRLVILRLMEAAPAGGAPLRAPAVITGGWESRGYKDFRSLAPALVKDDPTEGYAFLLQLVFEDLATDLPGIFGPVGLAALVPVPPATLRHAIEQLDQPELASCWTDDMTLGWVYQYWNDPAREALDAKLNGGGKVEPHEIASKTQMFTERYMVDWLNQNSLGPLWFAICARHGWTPEVQADGTLDRLETRRADWRAKRAAEQVALTDRMPLHTDAERRWAYYLPQPVPADAVDAAPDSIRDIRLIDPAVGSGHFLVVALDLLVALYREEARHRGEAGQPGWSDAAIVERILSHNLHGIDLDPRAVQIAAATLWLKARQVAPDARPTRLNLVAANLRLASLPDDDPALVELRREVERETGIPGALTDTLVHALRGADHLGSLLKVDAAVDAALAEHEAVLGRVQPEQGGLFGQRFAPVQTRLAIGREEAKATLLDRIEAFLAKHTGGEDLGLRLRGEQLAAGVRFVRMVREGTYDLVVANPPYQGTSKMADTKYVEKTYPLGKADLYAAFLLRGLELVKPGGVSAMLTMRNWMFIKTYKDLRAELLGKHGLRALGDFDRGAFESVPDEVVSVTVSAFARGVPNAESHALCPTPREDTARDADRTQRKRAATLCHEGRHTFAVTDLAVTERPLVYWWGPEMLAQFRRFPALGYHSPGKAGIISGDNARFVRRTSEIGSTCVLLTKDETVPVTTSSRAQFAPLVLGAKGLRWFEPLQTCIRWAPHGLAAKVKAEFDYGSYSRQIRNTDVYFQRGIAFSMVGNSFDARQHSYTGIIDGKGSSVFPSDLESVLCLLNSRFAQRVLSGLNPTINFQIGDVNRLPMKPTHNAAGIVGVLEQSFTVHESHREPSVEFRRPGPSPWRHAQEWAQAAVDRPDGAPLPDYVEVLDPEPPTDHVSFALGVALGRFGPAGSPQEGILDPATADLSHAPPAGILFLDTTLPDGDPRDSLGHPAAAPLHAAWATHGRAIDTRRKTLRDYLALDFFSGVHKGMYDNRPIHWPLSSAKKTFVAWVTIHRFTDRTLRVLLADHLVPTQARLEGELSDLRAARDGADPKAARQAEKQYDRVLKARDELADFIAAVEACADQGPPPTGPKCPPRAQDARYAPDLDDGVMINSAALWPLLEPQWKDPGKWWTELATAKGRKDYDWSHLAMRYWPERVDAKCQQDPSLGVAHGCFWRYHPERAWAWELRLQDEIGPDFRIEEAPYAPPGLRLRAPDPGDPGHRAAFLRDHPDAALAAIEKEAVRRMGRGKNKKLVPELRLLETGLWTGHAEALWELEMRLSEKQKYEFRVLAPDEPEGRAAFEAANPGRARARAQLIADLVPPPELFAAVEPER